MDRAQETSVSAIAGEPIARDSCGRQLSVLLLCDDDRGHANTVLDHIAALKRFSRHHVRIFNPCGLIASKYLDLDEFDVVVIHYSLKIISDYYLSSHFGEQLRRFQGLKVQFIQDEYRCVDEFKAMMRHLGIHVLFTLLSPSEIPKIYDEASLPGVVKLTTLAGYVPENLTGFATPAIEARPIDIGYRGRTCPYWLGRLAQEKVWIAQGVLARAQKYDLRCDIAWAEQDRIYGQRWNQFLMSCKATLGTESGASITDFDGSLERRTKTYLAEHPTADFHEVHREVLAPYEGNVPVTAISPRIFEAAALRTAMILFPGEYSGAVQPWVHYIPLAKDFSNMDEVAERLRDIPFLRAMTDKAYQDLVSSGRYSQRSFAQEVDAIVSAYGTPYGKRRKVWYQLARLERPCAVAVLTAREMARPVLQISQEIFKGIIALILMATTSAGAKVLFHYVTHRDFRRAVRANQLLRDILKLAVVKQAWGGAMAAKGRFHVSARFDQEKGRLMFESCRGSPSDLNDSTGSERPGVLSSTELFWPALESAVRERRLQAIVWNHSALGGDARYSLTSSLGFRVSVGDYDFHSFDGLVELGRRIPETTWTVLSSMLRRGERV